MYFLESTYLTSQYDMTLVWLFIKKKNMYVFTCISINHILLFIEK